MKQIALTQNKFAIVDDEDFEKLNQFKWHAEKRGDTFYARRSEGGRLHLKRFYMHRQVMAPNNNKIHCDHISGNGLDNRKSNLRLCTSSENLMNQRPSIGATSKYKGVYWDKSRNKWGSRIGINGIGIYIGRFLDEIEAAKAYNLKATELFGDFARLNTF